MIFRNKTTFQCFFIFPLQALQSPPLYIIFLCYLCTLDYSHATIVDVAETDCLTTKAISS